MRSIVRSRYLLVLLAVGFAVSAVWGDLSVAQERTARVYGVVRDNTGGMIPAATVVLSQAETGFKTELISNEAGVYNAPRLVPGTYTLEVEQAGFKKFVRAGLSLVPGDVIELNISLQVGERTDVVTVTEQTPLVNTSTGTSRSTLESAIVDVLPLNARDARELVKLTPGSVVDYTNTVHVNGIDTYQNNYSLDGTTNRDPYGHTQAQAPTPDALKEFSVETNYSAEYGNGAGAAILMTTKSGTNQLHGSVYDYFRAENLNANTFQRNYNNLGKGDFKRHQVGFTVGGPVVLPKLYNGKDKSFFFFSAQWLKVPSTPYVSRLGGLTAGELAGDFSQSKVIPRVSKSWSDLPNSPFAGMEGQQITNIGPYLNPISVQMYKDLQIPLETTSGNYTTSSYTTSMRTPEYVVRGDHSITKNNIISFSMFYKNVISEPTQADWNPVGFTRGSTNKYQHYTLADVWTLNPTMVNELRAGYLRYWQTTTNSYNGVDWDSYVNSRYAGAASILVGGGDPLFYTLQPSGFYIWNPPGSFTGRDAYDFNDTMSFTKGTHQFKFGGTFQILNTLNVLPSYHGSYFRGALNGTGLGNDAAEFLIGWPYSAWDGGSYYTPIGRHITSFFVQDDWKILPRLSLNLGFRYEPYLRSFVKDERTMMFKPYAQSTTYPKWPSGLLVEGDEGFSGNTGAPNDLNNFAPRLGAAYRLDDMGKKVIRGAWGMFYNDVGLGNDYGLSLSGLGFPFINYYTTTYNRGRPGTDWLDVPAYMGLSPLPDFSQSPDVANAQFDPLTAYGGVGGLTDGSVGGLHQYNLTYEQELQGGWMYSVGYQGHACFGCMYLADYWNLPVQKDSTDSWSAENLAARRPIQDYRYQDRTTLIPRGDAVYHGLQARIRARTPYFRLMGWYTLAYDRDNVDAFREAGLGPSHPGPLTDADWGPAVHARTHKVQMIPSWDLPFFRTQQNWMTSVFGGWNVTMVAEFQSGAHLDVGARNNTFQCQSCYMRADAVPGQELVFDDFKKRPGLSYVNPAAFAQPADRAYGNSTKNTVPWPMQKNVDMTLLKAFRIKEELRFELRGEFFNLFNWSNWNFTRYGPAVQSPATMNMTYYWTQPARTIQVSARVVF